LWTMGSRSLDQELQQYVRVYLVDIKLLRQVSTKDNQVLLSEKIGSKLHDIRVLK